MKRTPLYQEHVTMGANIVEYAGWDVPMHFKLGVVGEHNAVRASVGAFDASLMGDIIIKGDGATAAVQRIFTNDFTSCNAGESRYTHMLDEKGQIIDDPTVIRIAKDEYLCVPNAAATAKALEWITSNATGASVENHTGEVACVSVQGPKASGIVSKVFGGAVGRLKDSQSGFFPMPEAWKVLKDERPTHDSIFHRQLQQDMKVLVTRAGYTGEDGFEIIVPIRAGIQLWRNVLESEGGCVPIGLGARDTLRMEMGYPMSGQDFHANRTTLETRSERALNWNHDFVGKSALEAQKASGGYHVFSGLVLEEHGVPRGGCAVFNGSGELVGRLTSGAMSPTLGTGIGLGYFDEGKTSPGTPIIVEFKDKKARGKMAKLPLIKVGA
ncbi:MAG: glycine cleavage system aminomethyltransferase GcvT [Methanobacteriota archaeon]